MFKDNSYKSIIENIVLNSPKKGRGLYSKLATYLNTSSVVISQIFRGHKDLSLDQALLVSQFFNFTQLEQDYFLLLVGRDRSANHKLREYYDGKIQKLRIEADDLKKRVPVKAELPEEAKQIFYSDWTYSAIRMAVGLPSINSVEDLMKHFKMNYTDIKKKVDFLLEYGLIKKNGESLDFGLQSTHLSNTSPLINQHRQNWRLKAISKMGSPENKDLFYVGPMVLSEELANEMREELLKLISNMTKKIAESKNEKTFCLNIDFFGF